MPFSFRLNPDTAGNPTHRPTTAPTNPVEARLVDLASEDEVRGNGGEMGEFSARSGFEKDD
jgi:hypothetical protein